MSIIFITNLTYMEKLFSLAKKTASSKFFENFITIVILLAGLVVGLETSKGMSQTSKLFLNFLDHSILFIFVVEILINVLAEGKRPWRFFYDNWHIFDFIIVALCFIPIFLPDINANFFAVFRLARVLRLAKIFEKIYSLKLLLLSLLRSIPKMSYVLVLLLLLFYTYGVIATDLFGKTEPSFATLPASMKQLFFVAFEGWSWIYDLQGIQTLLENGFPDWILVMFFGTFLFISAMIFLNLFIGIITSEMENTRASEKRGKSKIFKKGHTLIMGWSESGLKIIEELIEANDNKESALIVVLADKDKDEMDFEISDRFHKKSTTKIICRTGSTTELKNLAMVNAWQARSIVILRDSNVEDADLNSLKTIIAIFNHGEDEETIPNLIAEMQDPRMIKIAKSITNGAAEFFDTEDFIARLIAQATIQPRLSVVYNEITGFQGSEIYINPIHPDLINKTYKQLLFSYEVSCPIGIISKENQVFINPAMNYILKDNDKLIILSEDDSTIKYKPIHYKIDENKINLSQNEAKLSQNYLMLGTNNKSARIIKEISDYLHADSNLTIVSQQANSFMDIYEYLCNEYGKNKNFKISEFTNNSFTFNTLSITCHLGDIEEFDVITKYAASANHIILLSYFDEIQDAEKADAISLVCLIHLRHISKLNGYGFSITTEIINDNNRQLINNPNVSDYIVSSNISSSIMAQLSEERELKKVFKVLFQAEGSEPYLRDVSKYLITDTQTNFATIVEAAARKGETAIGYAEEGNPPVFNLNPKKERIFNIKRKDQIIVLAEE